MRGLFGLLIVGSLFAIGTVVFGGLSDAYQLGNVATLPGTRVLLAGLGVIGGSVAALSSTYEQVVPAEHGIQTQRIYRPGLIGLAGVLFVGAGFLVFAESSGRSVQDLAVGDCFDNPTEESVELSLIELVPCEEPHDSEVYANVIVGGITSSFPGTSELDEVSVVRCLERFESFVGVTYDASILDITWLSPTASSWEQGDRQVTCAVYRLDGRNMTGSARNSGI